MPPAAVDKFIAQRGALHADATQEEIREISEKFRKAPIDKRVSAIQPMNAGGAGTVYGATLYLTDTATYLYCSPSGCSTVGKIGVEYRMGILGNLFFTLSGDLAVKAGPAVVFKDLNCYTYHDGALNIDTVVHTWDNCNKAEKYNSSTFTQIFSENWSGGTKGEIYHPTYMLRWRIPSGAEFLVGWDGREYKIDSNGSTRWL